MSQQTTVFLFRHGATNFSYVAIESIDNQRVLTDSGRRQIEAVGSFLNDFGLAEVISSPMKRTQETSQIIAETCGLPGFKINHDLAEIYSPVRYFKIKNNGAELVLSLAKQYSGQTIALVSHQDLIELTVRNLGATKEELDLPCLMAEGYRVLITDNKFISAQKLRPAVDVV